MLTSDNFNEIVKVGQTWRLHYEELPYTLPCTSYAGEFIERFSTEDEAREKARAYRDSDSDSMPVEISRNDAIVWESKSGLTL